MIIFFAKHNNIGPLIIAKNALASVEKIIKAAQTVTKKEEQMAVIEEKKQALIRFLNIIKLLIQNFSIVLCYQQDFYDKNLEAIADTMILS